MYTMKPVGTKGILIIKLPYFSRLGCVLTGYYTILNDLQVFVFLSIHINGFHCILIVPQNALIEHSVDNIK